MVTIYKQERGAVVEWLKRIGFDAEGRGFKSSFS